MSPAAVAAIIAASVSFLTLIVSVVAQIYGVCRTSRDTRLALEAPGARRPADGWK